MPVSGLDAAPFSQLHVEASAGGDGQSHVWRGSPSSASPQGPAAPPSHAGETPRGHRPQGPQHRLPAGGGGGIARHGSGGLRLLRIQPVSLRLRLSLPSFLPPRFPWDTCKRRRMSRNVLLSVCCGTGSPRFNSSPFRDRSKLQRRWKKWLNGRFSGVYDLCSIPTGSSA